MIWRITATESERAQRRAAAGLHDQGLREGDRVALIQPNSPQLLATILGALRTGIIPVLLHPGLLPAERQALLDDAEPKAVFAEVDRLPAADHEVDLHPVPRARPMHYTSGTSGRPKGVWTGVLSDEHAAALFADEVGPWRFDEADTTFIASPLYHSAAVRFSAMTLLSGGDVLLADKFDAAEAAHAFAAHHPTAAFVVPAHLQRLFAASDDGGQPLATESFRLLIHAGAPCPTHVKHRALDAFPPGAVWEFYGSTEGQFTICGPDDWLAHPGSVGRARPQRRLEIDDRGQVWCHAPPFARFEYWRDPSKTQAAWRDQAFTVGDLGRLDDDGFLYLDGRRDDLVITGGVNVYPAEVEQAIAALPGVHEVAVFGAPDDRWGQRVCAAVVADPDITAADIHEHARASLAAYKRPKDVYLVDDLPRTITGKVRRTALVDELGLG